MVSGRITENSGDGRYKALNSSKWQAVARESSLDSCLAGRAAKLETISIALIHANIIHGREKEVAGEFRKPSFTYLSRAKISQRDKEL